jgi:hypothetical protein
VQFSDTRSIDVLVIYIRSEINIDRSPQNKLTVLAVTILAIIGKCGVIKYKKNACRPPKNSTIIGM